MSGLFNFMDVLKLNFATKIDRLRLQYQGRIVITFQGISLREPKWSNSIAVGTKAFIEATGKEPGFRAKGRNVIGGTESYVLREPSVAYNMNSAPENDALCPQNYYFWKDID